MVSVAPVNAGYSFPKTNTLFSQKSSIIPKAVLAAATLLGGWYFGSTAMEVVGGSLLANSAWSWHKAPVLQMPAENCSLDAVGCRKLYHDMQLCGLNGENRTIAQQRYRQFYQAILSGVFIPSSEDEALIMKIAQVLAKTNDKPSVQTISYDIGRLYAETASGVSKNPTSHMQRFNEILYLLKDSTVANFVDKNDLLRLITVQTVLQRGNTGATSTNTVSHDVRSLLYRLQKEGVKDPSEVRRQVASLEAVLEGSHFQAEASADIAVIKSLLTASAAVSTIISSPSTSAPTSLPLSTNARAVKDQIMVLAADVLRSESVRELDRDAEGFQWRHDTIRTAIQRLSSQEQLSIAEDVQNLNMISTLISSARLPLPPSVTVAPTIPAPTLAATIPAPTIAHTIPAPTIAHTIPAPTIAVTVPAPTLLAPATTAPSTTTAISSPLLTWIQQHRHNFTGANGQNRSPDEVVPIVINAYLHALTQPDPRTAFFSAVDLLVGVHITGRNAHYLKQMWSLPDTSSGPVTHDAAAWRLQFQSANHIVKGQMRMQIFQENKRAAREGYMLSGTATRLNPMVTANMQQNTRLYAVTAPLAARPDYPPIGPSTNIEVINGDTIDVAFALKQQGYNPVAINMANENTPGGGVEHGSAAQEEAEFRRSNYHQSLYPTENPHLLAQMSGGTYKIPETGVIYSPNVQVFRKGLEAGFEFTQPRTMAFIAVAAYDLNPSHGHTPPGFNLTTAYRNGMIGKIRSFLRAAILEGHDAVDLGALGCGAFQNDPNVVAPLFLEVLREPEFVGRFRKVVFAVINDANGANYQPFYDALHGQPV